jgi:hypothetical protein
VYVLGGDWWNLETYLEVTGHRTGSTSEILRPGSSVWEEGPGLPGGEELAYSCAVAISSTTFLLIGGVHYSVVNSVLHVLGDSRAVHEFSSLTGVWTQWPVGLSDTRQQHACSSYQGKVVVAGGWKDDGRTKSSELLDPVTREIQLAGPMSTPRSSFGMYNIGYAGSRILMTFGSDGVGGPGSTAAGKQSLLQEWEPTDKVWKAAPAVMARRYAFAAVTVEARHVCPQGELLACSKA